MKKKTIYLGVLSGVFSSVCCLLYSSFYHRHFAYLSVDFSSVASPGGIIVACGVAGLFTSFAYSLAMKYWGAQGKRPSI